MQHNNQPIMLSQEDAEMAVDQLVNAQKSDGGNLTIYSGQHPDHGNVYIVIPPFGSSYLLLPIEDRSLTR